MPERETGIDLEQMQLTGAIALEVELGHAGQTDPRHDVATELPHIFGIADLQRRGVAIGGR
jgi:hypothetical protein